MSKKQKTYTRAEINIMRMAIHDNLCGAILDDDDFDDQEIDAIDDQVNEMTDAQVIKEYKEMTKN